MTIGSYESPTPSGGVPLSDCWLSFGERLFLRALVKGVVIAGGTANDVSAPFITFSIRGNNQLTLTHMHLFTQTHTPSHAQTQ